MAGGKFDQQAVYHGVKQHHTFTAPGHGGGPVDNAGKVAKCYLSDLSLFKRQNAYNYHTAYELCSEGMPGPKNVQKDKGTWGCNGEYVWREYSNGTDSGKDACTNVPIFKGDVPVVAGCRTLFGFRNVSTAVPVCMFHSPCIITPHPHILMHAAGGH